MTTVGTVTYLETLSDLEILAEHARELEDRFKAPLEHIGIAMKVTLPVSEFKRGSEPFWGLTIQANLKGYYSSETEAREAVTAILPVRHYGWELRYRIFL